MKINIETGIEEFHKAAAKTGSTCISTSMEDSKEIPTAICMFWGSGNTMALSGRLQPRTGYQKFKMAATKPEVPVYQLVCKIAKNFQRLSACFWGRGTQWRYWLCSILVPELRNSRWRLPKPYLYLSFWDRGTQQCYWEGSISKPEVRNSR
jgi:hypothetical protein